MTIEYSPLDALIEQRPALDRGTLDTDRADNTVLTILDPLAITDEHTFRWGEPPHTYSRSKQSTGCYRTKKPARDTPPKSPLSGSRKRRI